MSKWLEYFLLTPVQNTKLLSFIGKNLPEEYKITEAEVREFETMNMLNSW